MTQLRLHAPEFNALHTQILVVGPEDAPTFQRYWRTEHPPFPGLPDPQRIVLNAYGQEIKIFRLGRLPAQVLINQAGIVRDAHYGGSMRDIPAPERVLERIAKEISA